VETTLLGLNNNFSFTLSLMGMFKYGLLGTIVLPQVWGTIVTIVVSRSARSPAFLRP
jgi:hypothetical protein